MESASPIIEAALQQMRGQLLPRAPIRVVLNHVMVSALRATQEAERQRELLMRGKERVADQRIAAAEDERQDRVK